MLVQGVELHPPRPREPDLRWRSTLQAGLEQLHARGEDGSGSATRWPCATPPACPGRTAGPISSWRPAARRRAASWPVGQEGGRCGDGINSCCAGWRCTGGSCAACARGGQACAATAECCTGTCQNGACIGGLGGVCVSQAGCSQGECRDGRCQCAVDQILCNSGCVSYTDPNNCRGCGNVCATGTGRVCTVNGCVCDPQSAFPDECNGACVNKSNDRTNCGFCSFTCPRLDQVCTNGALRLPGRDDRLQRELRRHQHQPESLRHVQPWLPGRASRCAAPATACVLRA